MWYFLLVSAVAEVHVSLKAHWKGLSKSSLVQEASECLWDLDPQLFWGFLSEGGPWEDRLSGGLRDLCWTSLYNREYSVRMEFFGSVERDDLGENCVSVSTQAGRLSCGPSEVHKVDHVFREGSETIVAYLDLNHPDFSRTHQALQDLSIQKNLTYVFRHLDTRENSEDLLGGYGAELLLKNMEYKPIEDTSVQMTTEEGDWNLESNF